MASAIDKSKPVAGSPLTLSVRDNFGFAEKEINELMRTTEDQVTATGTVDALLANFTEDVVLAEGIEVVILASGANTGAATLDVDSTGAKSIVRKNGNALVANDILGNRHRCVLRYDATNTVWVLQNHAVWNDSQKLGGVIDTSYARSDAADTISAIHTHTARPAFNGGTTGTDSPFTVDSTFVVASLNADLLDGVEGASYARSDAVDTISAVQTHTAIPAFNGGVSGSTAPFTCDSTFVVANLNASLLEGQNSSYHLTYENFTGTIATLAPASGNAAIELGSITVGSTPLIDFHSGATSVDFDTRIIASGGDGTVGGGLLQLEGKTVRTNKSFGIGNITPGGTFNNDKALAIGDTDTGMRQNGDGVLELWTNDVSRVVVDVNGLDVVSGTLEVGGLDVRNSSNQNAGTLPAARVPAATTTAVGGLETATDAEANTGTATNKIIVPSNFNTKSHAADGHQKFPGGLVMQWGQVAITATTTSITYPVAFGTVFIVTAITRQEADTGGVDMAAALKTAPTTTGADFSTASGHEELFWFAIGI